MSAGSPGMVVPIYYTRSLSAHPGDSLQPLTCECISGAEQKCAEVLGIAVGDFFTSFGYTGKRHWNYTRF